MAAGLYACTLQTQLLLLQPAQFLPWCVCLVMLHRRRLQQKARPRLNAQNAGTIVPGPSSHSH
jgi:hypothetical protein